MTLTPPRVDSSAQKTHLEVSLGIAGFLLAEGVPFLGCKPINTRGQYAFLFSNNKEEATTALLRYAGRATCVASDLINSLESLKAVLRDAKAGGARG